MKDLFRILTTDENGKKYTAKDYIVGFALSVLVIILTSITL
jgi:heme/copper-type cytochrome/quinol oxidase subunit 4